MVKSVLQSIQSRQQYINECLAEYSTYSGLIERLDSRLKQKLSIDEFNRCAKSYASQQYADFLNKRADGFQSVNQQMVVVL